MDVQEGSTDEISTISNLQDVWVMANVYESDISKIKMGLPVRITTVAYPDKEFVGEINKIFNILDAESKVRIVLKNPGFMLKPEMFANVVVTSPTTEKKVYEILSALTALKIWASST